MHWFSLLCWYFLTQTDSFDSIVYFRKHREGSIWSKASRCSHKERLKNLTLETSLCQPLDVIELEGTDQAARFISLSLHSYSRSLYWSDSKSIKRGAIDGYNIQTVVGVIATVRFYGFHLSQEDVRMITIRDVPCLSITKKNDTFVECLGSLPFSQNEWQKLTESDCVLETARGKMKGVTENAEDMERMDAALPTITFISLTMKPVLPRSLAFNPWTESTPSDNSDWLYWSNSADGRLYRTHTRTNALEEIANDVWDLRGIVISKRWNAIFFSLEYKGKLMYKDLNSLHPGTPAILLLENLKAPRGLALNKAQDTMYLTEKTGRIYQVHFYVKGTKLKAFTRNVITLPSITRLDGIAVSDAYLYWAETNWNLIARASLDTLRRQVFIGSRDHANSRRISWPRSIVIAENKIEDTVYFSEYIGRISMFSVGEEVKMIINELKNNGMKDLDLRLQYDSIASTDLLHFFALE
uniref:Uncharacterized protein AlNc14C236G9403 n=1 Tax=Albugo laibachii Nc14 TaxID=890382 RepID=F0W8B7_9STRA|nr:conserved hypothetical protein [Albugo laibachii Nc14]CCA24385.1 conserved hypothetical protein [Albugo laibachii Nc14]|eukprot:CCA24385.1 conserved hypothetical protein [Albugo laibachii Nc14]